MENHLLIVDPQNDFCDLPERYWPPSPALDGDDVRERPQLPVPGAHDDLCRLAQFITRHGERLADITVTLDSHHRVGIERPGFWVRAGGGDVAPFTTITAGQVRAGAFSPRDAAQRTMALSYLDALERAGRYTLMVWPVHCELGTWGHAVHPAVRAAYNAWEERGARQVRKILKGMNPHTEHYSAVQAEVPDDSDPGTRANRELLDALEHADRILIAGEAGSHCVRATTEHLLQYLPPGPDRRYVLLTDCMSPVSGFEAAFSGFLDDAARRGVRRCTADEAAGSCGS